MPKRDGGPGTPIDDPKYWRTRAEATRASAARMVDATARRAMIGLARSYDELARRTQMRLPARPRPEEKE